MRFKPALSLVFLMVIIACSPIMTNQPGLNSSDTDVVPTPSNPPDKEKPIPSIPAPLDPTPQSSSCAQDVDCVPASCCHPKTCVPKSQQPDCSATLCTMSCEPGTMDCGQGTCACEQNSCVAKITPMDDLPQ